MNTRTSETPIIESRHGNRLPWVALLVMALTGFIIIATETMPAGLLPQIAVGLNISEGTAGQFVSSYALGTVIAAIPAITLTRGMPRKPLLIIGLVGFLIANTMTALSSDLMFSLVARFIAGAFSGLLWGMLAGYARRIVSPVHAGRALAIAMTGTPVALAVGTPLGSWIGTTSDWRWSFGAMSILSIIAIFCAVVFVPDASGQQDATKLPLVRVFGIPGVSVVLAVVFAWMLAHNVLYTYIASYLGAAEVNLPVEVALVVFGAAALIGIWITGVVIDRALRHLVILSITTFAVAGAILTLGLQSQVALLIAIALWGLAFGGSATQLQTAMAKVSGENADVANSVLTVSFNLAIFAAGVLGALVVDIYGAMILTTVMIGFSLLALTIVLAARSSAFPAAS